MVGKAKTAMQKHRQPIDFQVFLILNQQTDSEHRITLSCGASLLKKPA
jgi:hypothetical protein